VYDRERPKWDGRESVLEWEVPHLGVPWGDTVNLAALDPVHLIEARRRLGIPFSHLLERRVVRIPVERIADQPAVVYNSRSHWLNSRPGEDVPATPPEGEFSPFNPDIYEELAEVPELHLDYLAEQRDAGRFAPVSCSSATSSLPVLWTSAASRSTPSDLEPDCDYREVGIDQRPHGGRSGSREGLGPGGFKVDGWGIRPSCGCLTSRNRGPTVHVVSRRRIQRDGKLKQGGRVDLAHDSCGARHPVQHKR
jgi:hypothetical protein